MKMKREKYNDVMMIMTTMMIKTVSPFYSEIAAKALIA